MNSFLVSSTLVFPYMLTLRRFCLHAMQATEAFRARGLFCLLKVSALLSEIFESVVWCWGNPGFDRRVCKERLRRI